MRIHFLLIAVVIGSVHGLFENSGISLTGTNNVSCFVNVDLTYTNSMVPNSVWDFLNTTASGVSVFPGLSGLLSQLRGIQDTWRLRQNISVGNIFDFCFVINIASNLTNGTVVTNTFAGGFSGYNIFKPYIQSRCSRGQFSPSTRTNGYGECDTIPFLMYANNLCICSTSNCNSDYATCVASAQVTTSTTLSNIVINMPDQPNITSCLDGYQGLSYILHSFARNQLGGYINLYNVTGLLGIQNRLAACGILHNAGTGEWFRFRLGYEEFSAVYFARMILRNLNLYNDFSETRTSLAVRHPCINVFRAVLSSTVEFFSQVACICSTNDCNIDIQTCAVGLNMTTITRTGTNTIASSRGNHIETSFSLLFGIMSTLVLIALKTRD